MADERNLRDEPFYGSLRNLEEGQVGQMRVRTSDLNNSPQPATLHDNRSRSRSIHRQSSATPSADRVPGDSERRSTTPNVGNTRRSSNRAALDDLFEAGEQPENAVVKEFENTLDAVISVANDYKDSVLEGSTTLFLISFANSVFFKILGAIFGRADRVNILHVSIVALYVLINGVISSTIHRLVYGHISHRYRNLSFVDHVIMMIENVAHVTFFHFIDNSVAIAYVLWGVPAINRFSTTTSTLFHGALLLSVLFSCCYRYAHAHWIRYPSNFFASLKFSEKQFQSNFYQTVAGGVFSQVVRLSLILVLNASPFFHGVVRNRYIEFATHFYTFTGVFFYHVQQLALL